MPPLDVLPQANFNEDLKTKVYTGATGRESRKQFQKCTLYYTRLLILGNYRKKKSFFLHERKKKCGLTQKNPIHGFMDMVCEMSVQ